jgi:hypothetical protein
MFRPQPLPTLTTGTESCQLHHHHFSVLCSQWAGQASPAGSQLHQSFEEAHTHMHQCQGLSSAVPAVPISTVRNLSCLAVPRADVVVGAALVFSAAADSLLQPAEACPVRGSAWYAAVAAGGPSRANLAALAARQTPQVKQLQSQYMQQTSRTRRDWVEDAACMIQSDRAPRWSPCSAPLHIRMRLSSPDAPTRRCVHGRCVHQTLQHS